MRTISGSSSNMKRPLLLRRHGPVRHRPVPALPLLLLLLLLCPALADEGIVVRDEGEEEHEICTDVGGGGGGESPTCKKTAEDTADEEEALDPNLRPMTLDDGSVFQAYVRPDVSTFYRGPDGEPLGVDVVGEMREVKPAHTGIAGRFTNLSPEEKSLMWLPDNPNQANVLISNVPAFETAGTATFFTHRFCFAPVSDREACQKTFVVKPGVARYSYDPYEEDPTYRGGIEALNSRDRSKYDKLKADERFAELYKEFTGRDYLALHPRPRAMHKMWPADYFGQRHTVDTRETHFVSLPPQEELGRITAKGLERRLSEGDPRVLQEYRSPEPTMTMTLKVLSCAPRAFEIRNFLSDAEVDHVMYLATGMTLGDSTVSGRGTDGKSSTTRTSKNTWIYREHSPIVDTIYRRAADLLRIDEALLRPRGEEEYPDLGSKRSIAEALQLVHYDPGQQYTAHHDFGHPNTMDDRQPTRFATLLLYLNEGMDGGETAFPRWVNAETSGQLKVTPEKGKAVLFYSFLPDGNMDDLSQHAALPVKKGEKWLTNLWVWDPIYEK